jgi:hypothetical protein
MNTKELVIHRYTNKCKTVQLPPGFADFLKGTLYLYQSSLKIPNMELLVDFSHHPVGMFIEPMPKNTENPYEYWIQKEDMSTEIMECFNNNSYKLKEMLRMIREKGTSPPTNPSNNGIPLSNPYYLTCHEAYDGFDEGIESTDYEMKTLGKSFMKSVLRFNQEITEDCDYINLYSGRIVIGIALRAISPTICTERCIPFLG